VEEEVAAGFLYMATSIALAPSFPQALSSASSPLYFPLFAYAGCFSLFPFSSPFLSLPPSHSRSPPSIASSATVHPSSVSLAGSSSTTSSGPLPPPFLLPWFFTFPFLFFIPYSHYQQSPLHQATFAHPPLRPLALKAHNKAGNQSVNQGARTPQTAIRLSDPELTLSCRFTLCFPFSSVLSSALVIYLSCVRSSVLDRLSLTSPVPPSLPASLPMAVKAKKR